MPGPSAGLPSQKGVQGPGAKWREVLPLFLTLPDRLCARCLSDQHALWRCPLWWGEFVEALDLMGFFGGVDRTLRERVETCAVLNVRMAYPRLQGGF